MYRCKWIFVTALIALSLLTACRRRHGEAPLRCYVGGTMRPAMEELAAQWERKTGQKVEIDYAGSGELLVKIRTTRSGDLYVCHDPFNGALMGTGLGREAWTVAALTPVIAVAKGNPKQIRGAADLAREDVRVALTHPVYSTAGHIVKVVLDKSDLAEAVKARTVTVTKQGGEAANAVAIGTVDAAIVWNAVASLRRERLDMVPIERRWMPQAEIDAITSATYGRIEMDQVRVTISTLKCSRQPEQARRFAEFVASPEGMRVFAARGFTPPDPTRTAQDAAVPKLRGKLLVHCGAGMRKPIARLAKEFTAKTDARIEVNYAGSNVLLGQIDLSRRGDVYLPGDADYIRMARRKWLVTYDRPICWFVPVIMVPRGNPKEIRSLADLARPGLRVGLGDEKSCAVGRLSRPLFERAGVDFDKVRQNIVLNTPTVNELAMKIKLGTVDAVIVWSSIAAQYPDDSETVAIPVEQNVIPTVAAATLTTTEWPPAARAFVDFLASARGREVLEAEGYVVIDPRAASD